MSWTKLGDEHAREVRAHSDAAFRLHVEALGHSNAYGLDHVIPKDDLYRLSWVKSADPADAAAELVRLGYWEDRGDAWFIGVRHPEWQLEAVVVDHRKEQTAERQRRKRLHDAGDHSRCLPDRECVTGDVTRDTTRHPGRVGSGRNGKTKERLEEEKERTGANVRETPPAPIVLATPAPSPASNGLPPRPRDPWGTEDTPPANGHTITNRWDTRR